MAADVDPAAAAATRGRMRDEYGDQDILIIGTHYAGCTAGRIVKRDGGWIFQGTS